MGMILAPEWGARSAQIMDMVETRWSKKSVGVV